MSSDQAKEKQAPPHQETVIYQHPRDRSHARVAIHVINRSQEENTEFRFLHFNKEELYEEIYRTKVLKPNGGMTVTNIAVKADDRLVIFTTSDALYYHINITWEV